MIGFFSALFAIRRAVWDADSCESVLPLGLTVCRYSLVTSQGPVFFARSIFTSSRLPSTGNEVPRRAILPAEIWRVRFAA